MDTRAILAAVESHALATGLFERVNKHELTHAPGHGLSLSIWSQRIGPVAAGSGLNVTSVRVVFNLRAYSSLQQEPLDEIDPELNAAVDTLMDAYTRNFSLGGLIRNVDLFGAHGPALEAVAGYVQMAADRVELRTMTITLPLIVNDAWTQEA